MIKVCTYSKYSSKEIEAQRWPEHHKLITDLLEHHRDWDNQQNFVDIQSTSYDDSLSTKEIIVSMAKEGKLQLLLIPTISMLGRNVNEVLSFARELNDSGCRIYAIREGISPSEEQLRQLNAFTDIAKSVEQINQAIEEAETNTPYFVDATCDEDVFDYVKFIDEDTGLDLDNDKISIKFGEHEIRLPMTEYNEALILNALTEIGNDFNFGVMTM